MSFECLVLVIVLLLGTSRIHSILFCTLWAKALKHFAVSDHEIKFQPQCCLNPDAPNSQRDGEVPSVPPGKTALSVKDALVDKYQWWHSHDSLRSVLETQLSDVFLSSSDSPQQNVLHQCFNQNDQGIERICS